LDRAGGTMTVEALAASMGVSRAWEFRRRIVSRLQAARVVECSGNEVSLVSDWLEVLNEERENAGEIAAYRRDMARYERERVGYGNRSENKPHRSPSQEDLQDFRESYPGRRREAIEAAMARLFRESPEYRTRRVGQITCRLVSYLSPDFPRGPDGVPKDAEIEAIRDGVAA
jgi:hypothetical protein